MTRQTVSICNIKGGVALEPGEACVIADLLEFVERLTDLRPDDAEDIQARARLRRVIRVLRGEAPAELGEFA